MLAKLRSRNYQFKIGTNTYNGQRVYRGSVSDFIEMLDSVWRTLATYIGEKIKIFVYILLTCCTCAAISDGSEIQDPFS